MFLPLVSPLVPAPVPARTRIAGTTCGTVGTIDRRSSLAPFDSLPLLPGKSPVLVLACLRDFEQIPVNAEHLEPVRDITPILFVGHLWLLFPQQVRTLLSSQSTTPIA